MYHWAWFTMLYTIGKYLLTSGTQNDVCCKFYQQLIHIGSVEFCLCSRVLHLFFFRYPFALTFHYVKIVQIRIFFYSVFSHIPTSVLGHISRSVSHDFFYFCYRFFEGVVMYFFDLFV